MQRYVCQSSKTNFSATDFCAIIWILGQLLAAGWMTYYGVHGNSVKRGDTESIIQMKKGNVGKRLP